MFDVEELSTHGGSLRIFAKHKDDKTKSISPNVAGLLQREEAAGMKQLDYYNNFQPRVENIKYAVWEFLIKAQREGKTVIGYGAAAKAGMEKIAGKS
jgi:hypothetical protein